MSDFSESPSTSPKKNKKMKIKKFTADEPKDNAEKNTPRKTGKMKDKKKEADEMKSDVSVKQQRNFTS